LVAYLGFRVSLKGNRLQAIKEEALIIELLVFSLGGIHTMPGTPLLKGKRCAYSPLIYSM